MGCRTQSCSGSKQCRRTRAYRVANAPYEVVKDEIEKAKAATDKPFGVNIMLLSPHAESIAKLVVEEGVKVVTTGAGSP